MKSTKNFIAMSLAAVALTSGIALTGQAEAKPGKDNPRNCAQYDCAYQVLTPEKQTQYDAIVKEFTDKTASLRDKLSAKQIELRTLGSNPTPDPKVIGKASEELVALRNEFAKEREAMAERIAKEVGVNIFQGREHRNMIDSRDDRSPRDDRNPRMKHNGTETMPPTGKI